MSSMLEKNQIMRVSKQGFKEEQDGNRGLLIRMDGFSLVEMLISIVIFSLVIMAIYFFFDRGQWLYLSSEKRVNIQENARLILEQMERDFRMIGAGVPSGRRTSDSARWKPFVFSAMGASIGFTGDINNGSALLTRDVGTVDNQHIFIANPGETNAYYRSFDANGDDILDTPLPIVLVRDQRTWEDLVANALDSSDTALVTTTNVTDPPIYTADKSSVHTLVRVFYRMVDQSGNADTDGVCTDPYPFCTIQRQEFMTNDPTETTPASTDWITLGTNVTILSFAYFNVNGASTGDLNAIAKIDISLTCRDRDLNPGLYQPASLKTEVLIRNKRL